MIDFAKHLTKEQKNIIIADLTDQLESTNDSVIKYRISIQDYYTKDLEEYELLEFLSSHAHLYDYIRRDRKEEELKPVILSIVDKNIAKGKTSSEFKLTFRQVQWCRKELQKYEEWKDKLERILFYLKNND